MSQYYEIYTFFLHPVNLLHLLPFYGGGLTPYLGLFLFWPWSPVSYMNPKPYINPTPLNLKPKP